MTYESQAVQPPAHRPERTPGMVKWAIGGLWFQTVVNALGVLLLFSAAQDRADHGQDGAGLLRTIGVVSLLVAVLLAVCAIMAVRGTPWVWWLAIGLQVIAMVGGLITLVSGNVGTIVGIAVAAGIVWLLRARESQEWFGR
jgi:hypothetical protein